MSTGYDNSPETRKHLYERTRAELLAKQLANSTSYDTAVLTLSSAFLGLSITFTKDVASPLPEASVLWALYTSWTLFCLAITGTVSSFLVGQSGIRQSLDGAKRYYLHQEAEAQDDSKRVSRMIDALNLTNGVFFVLGTVFILVFSVANFMRLAELPIARKSQEIQCLQSIPLPQAASAPVPNARPASAPKTGA